MPDTSAIACIKRYREPRHKDLKHQKFRFLGAINCGHIGLVARYRNSGFLTYAINHPAEINITLITRICM